MSETPFSVRKHIVRLTQADAEIRFLVSCAVPAHELHVRGRLMGPRCPYASTVEVAYPLRELERNSEQAPGTSILLRTVIPEPSMWEPESPFLYSGPLGIWQGDKLLDQQDIQIGFIGWGLGTRGLRVNGKYIDLEASVVAGLDVEAAARLREQKVNCLVVDIREAPPSTWDMADRYGFFVLGRINDPAAWEIARRFEGRPSSLGWILRREALAGMKPKSFDGTSYTGSAPLIGLEVEHLPAQTVPGISFLVAAPGVLEQPNAIGLPWLRVERAGDDANSFDLSAGILGTLRNWPLPGSMRL
jgi:Glycosyl hydrolases family 2